MYHGFLSHFCQQRNKILISLSDRSLTCPCFAGFILLLTADNQAFICMFGCVIYLLLNAIIMSERCFNLIDIYQIFECHGMRNAQLNYFKNNHKSKQLKLICMDGLIKSLFLDEPFQRLTNNQAVGQSVKPLPGGASRPFLTP